MQDDMKRQMIDDLVEVVYNADSYYSVRYAIRDVVIKYMGDYNFMKLKEHEGETD